MAKSKTIPATYQLKIRLLEIEPPIWRRVQVPGSMKLNRLHDVFQIVMGWTDSHLHDFEKDGQCWGMMPGFDPMDDVTTMDERGAVLSKVLPSAGDRLIYEYDFGDGWQHEVVVENIEPAGRTATPVCLAGERHCPPEDVGGPPGYENFLEIIFDPAHEDFENMVRWVGGRFQPEEFDLNAVNRKLGRRKWPAR